MALDSQPSGMTCPSCGEETEFYLRRTGSRNVNVIESCIECGVSRIITTIPAKRGQIIAEFDPITV